MGGPGSGRYPKGSTAAAVQVVRDLGDLHRLSRAELEPILCRAVEVGNTAEADAIRTELASRTWQNINPYAPR